MPFGSFFSSLFGKVETPPEPLIPQPPGPRQLDPFPEEDYPEVFPPFDPPRGDPALRPLDPFPDYPEDPGIPTQPGEEWAGGAPPTEPVGPPEPPPTPAEPPEEPPPPPTPAV
jgi:hypothetical protein